MAQEQTTPLVERLSADERWEITDVLARYCVALDDRQFEELENLFTPDVEWDYGSFGSGSGVEALADVIGSGLLKLDATHHAMSATQVVTPTADGASVRSYICGQHIRQGARAGHLFMVAGWYRDDFVRTEDGWRIARRRYENVWMEGNPTVLKR